jgi:hypothetical protein
LLVRCCCSVDILSSVIYFSCLTHTLHNKEISLWKQQKRIRLLPCFSDEKIQTRNAHFRSFALFITEWKGISVKEM